MTDSVLDRIADAKAKMVDAGREPSRLRVGTAEWVEIKAALKEDGASPLLSKVAGILRLKGLWVQVVETDALLEVV